MVDYSKLTITTSPREPEMAQVKKRELNLERLQMEIRLHYPGFAILAGMTEWFVDESIPSACTNGRYVKFSKTFMDRWNFQEQVFVVLHELLHIVRKHMIYRGARDHELFNIACDHFVNLLLKSTCGNRAKMPQVDGSDFGHADSRFEGMTEFEIYDILAKEEQESPGKHKGSSGCLGEVEDLQGSGSESEGEDTEGGEIVTPAEIDAMVDEINRAIQTAEVVGRMSGKGASIWQKLADEIRQPEIVWESILRRFMTNVFPAYRAWSQLDRRMLSIGVPYPAVVKKGTEELVFAVDCSGSMPRELVQTALTEVVEAMEQCHIVRMHIIYFCDGVEHHDTFNRSQTPKLLERFPNGGTCIQSMLNYVADKCPSAKGIICMTDSDGGRWGEKPNVPVIWGLSKSGLVWGGEPPHGEHFVIPEEDYTEV